MRREGDEPQDHAVRKVQAGLHLNEPGGVGQNGAHIGAQAPMEPQLNAVRACSIGGDGVHL
eukprot:851102-Heterocapsa_arctica.AAC.1